MNTARSGRSIEVSSQMAVEISRWSLHPLAPAAGWSAGTFATGSRNRGQGTCPVTDCDSRSFMAGWVGAVEVRSQEQRKHIFAIDGSPDFLNVMLIAAGQNLKRFLAATGWGRRQVPCGSIVTLPREPGGSRSSSDDDLLDTDAS